MYNSRVTQVQPVSGSNAFFPLQILFIKRFGQGRCSLIEDTRWWTFLFFYLRTFFCFLCWIGWYIGPFWKTGERGKLALIGTINSYEMEWHCLVFNLYEFLLFRSAWPCEKDFINFFFLRIISRDFILHYKYYQIDGNRFPDNDYENSIYWDEIYLVILCWKIKSRYNSNESRINKSDT
jgi:hypothetical protein